MAATSCLRSCAKSAMQPPTKQRHRGAATCVSWSEQRSQHAHAQHALRRTMVHTHAHARNHARGQARTRALSLCTHGRGPFNAPLSACGASPMRFISAPMKVSARSSKLRRRGPACGIADSCATSHESRVGGSVCCVCVLQSQACSLRAVITQNKQLQRRQARTLALAAFLIMPRRLGAYAARAVRAAASRPAS